MTREFSAVDTSESPTPAIAANVGENISDAEVNVGGHEDTCGSRRPRRPVSYPCGPESEIQPPLRIELVGFDATAKRNSDPLKVMVAFIFMP